MLLAEKVSVARRFQRAVRVDTDMSVASIEGFITTPTAVEVLMTTARHVGERAHGAFTWTGPYGCGKSSLATVLAALLGQDAEARDAAIAVLGADVAEAVASTIGRDALGHLIIPVVGSRRDAVSALAEAAERAGVAVEGAGIVAALAAAAKAGPKILVIVDEMGKLLEHASIEGGDVHLFQDLAEVSSRSGGNLLVIGVLHQAFDDYAHRLAREARDEWLKVQGRFVDVPVNLAGEEQLELVARAIVSEGEAPLSFPAEAVAAAVSVGRRGTADALAERLRRCWPLNPVVACLLGPLSRRRFGQNQRSIFGFLNSAEPYGFQDFLSSTEAGSDALYDTDWLWNYLRSNLEPSIIASPDGHRWSTAVDAVERCEARAAHPAQVSIVKTVALVDMLRDRSGLVPSTEVLAAANPGLSQNEIARFVEGLRSWSILIERRHLGSVSIYAGSDFDLDEALASARAEAGDLDLTHLRSIGVLAPVLAKRHYHMTGALRWFDVDVATLDEAEERISRYGAARGAAGLFLLLLNVAGDDKRRVAARLAHLRECVGDRPIALGVASDGYSIRELASELVAYDRIQATRAELRGDPVARRELAGAAARCSAELEDRLRASLDATGWEVPVLAQEGTALPAAFGGAARLAAIASEIADRLYADTPRIANELLNRTKPSSNAVAASRILMHAMVGRGDQPRLGIENFPAEGGLYASILEEAGLHREVEGDFVFAAPAGEDRCHLLPAWKEADRLLSTAGPGASLGQIYAVWRDRPFGMRDGILPVLALAYLLSRLDRVTVYLDEIFVPAPSDFLVDRLLQSPDAIRLRWSEYNEDQQATVVGVAKIVSTLSGALLSSADPLAVSRALVGLVVSSAPWSLRTTRLSPTALRVRDLGKKASDPNKLLLDDLPHLFGTGVAPNGSSAEIAAAIDEGLRELRGAYGQMLGELTATMLNELRADFETDEDFGELHERALTVVSLTGNYRLDAFATRLSTFDGSTEAIEGLAGLAANKPTREWVDRDVDAARVELAALAQEFLRAEGLAHVKGRRARRVRIALFISEPGRPALVKQEVSVNDRERKHAHELAAKMRETLKLADIPRSVAIAALAEAMSSLADGDDGIGDVVPLEDHRRRSESL